MQSRAVNWANSFARIQRTF